MTSTESFDIKIIRKRENKLIGRIEVDIELNHVGKGTPPRHIIRRRIAELLGRPIDVVYVRKLITEYGIGRTLGEVHIYHNSKRAKEIEPEYVIVRNLDPEERRKILEARRGG